MHQDKFVLVSYLIAALAALLVMHFHLLAALFAGLTVNALVHAMAPKLASRAGSRRGKLIAVTLLASLVLTSLLATGWATVSFLRSEAGSLSALLQRMAELIASSRGQLPEWVQDNLPFGVDALRERMIDWVQRHAHEARTVGEEAGRTIVHVLVGMVIGAMVATHEAIDVDEEGPLADALSDRADALARAFEKIVFAQVRIAAVNAALTAAFLLMALPAFGIELPLRKTLIAITFVAGMLPVIGNLISNVFIVVVALSHSLQVAVAALLFLVIIHKLEYFLNARIIGAYVDAHAWELLLAMLLMEAIFGLPGVVAAPVFYAWIKSELSQRRLI